MEEYMPKSVDSTLLERRCIRRYALRAIPEDDLAFIRAAVRNTPTSYNAQQFSVIEVTDQGLKDELAALIGQTQLKYAAVDFMFLSDFHKMSVAAKARGLPAPEFQNTADGLVVGTIDASLAMMSAIVAAVSRGLGTCPIGYARTVDPEKITEILKLPKGVYLVCALAVGVPADMPDLKPKQPEDLVFFKNTYGTEDMAKKLLAYDETIKAYHKSRTSNQSDEDWIGQMLAYYQEAMKTNFLHFLQGQGYGLKK